MEYIPTLDVIRMCRISDDCIGNKRRPLFFMARAVLTELIASLQRPGIILP
ncbi:MAG: hypothetical protein WCZ18_06460 [Ottowia sp.]|nr:hypothetical protein [Ottowia sp.]